MSVQIDNDTMWRVNVPFHGKIRNPQSDAMTETLNSCGMVFQGRRRLHPIRLVEGMREHAWVTFEVYKMTKSNLIDHVTEATKGTKKETEQVVDAVLTSITDALLKGEKVDLRGFGSFQVSGKKERRGRNPRTGEAMTIAARNVAVFKPSKELFGRLNGGSEDEPGAVTTDTVAQHQQGSEKVHGDKLEA